MGLLDRDAQSLLLAVMRRPAKSGVAPIDELTNKVTCWEATIDAAKRHGILPMLHAALASSQGSIPQEVLDRVKRESERNSFHCIANAAELLAVLREFENAGIAAIPFKGVVLGASAYGDMTARTAGDLDVLIFRRDLLRAVPILVDRGYELKTKVLEDGSPEAAHYFEYHLERAADGMVLELRWRLELTQPRFRRELGMDWVWPKRRTAKLGGAEVPNLDPVSALLVLCMHGSKHVWSRLIWIYDVAKLIESEPGLDWRFAEKEAKRVGLWRCLALGTLLAQRATGIEVPAEVQENFMHDRTASRLAEFLYAQMFDIHQMPAGRVPYNLQLLGFGDRARALLTPSIFRPNEWDRAFVKLPRALEPLYYVIRPIRILLDRSGR